MKTGWYRCLNGDVVMVYNSSVIPNTGIVVWYGSRPMHPLIHWYSDGSVFFDYHSPTYKIRLDTYAETQELVGK